MFPMSVVPSILIPAGREDADVNVTLESDVACPTRDKDVEGMYWYTGPKVGTKSYAYAAPESPPPVASSRYDELEQERADTILQFGIYRGDIK